jgi:TATA-box binding protein (TBP) (component of TFIID and TFIIIB)
MDSVIVELEDLDLNDKKEDHEAEYCPLTASNYVCTAELLTSVNTVLITYFFYGRSSSKIFPSSVIRTRNPRVAFQIFKTGCIVASGAASKNEANLAIHKLVNRLSVLLNKRYTVHNFRVVNIVAFGGLGYKFNQSLFYEDHQMIGAAQVSLQKAKPATTRRSVAKNKKLRMQGICYCEFNPAQFRGLQYFIDYPAVVVMFDSGQYVVTGSNDEKDIVQYVDSIPFDKYRAGKEYRPFDADRAKLRKVDLDRSRMATIKKRRLVEPRSLYQMLNRVKSSSASS